MEWKLDRGSEVSELWKPKKVKKKLKIVESKPILFWGLDISELRKKNFIFYFEP